jgi:chromosome segregation ATPase
VLQNLACKVEWLLSEKVAVESELQDLLTQKGDLDVRLENTESRMKELESRLQEEKFNRLYQLLGMLVLNLSSIHDTVCCAVMGHRTELRFLCTLKFSSLFFIYAHLVR